ncbi:MAG: heterodisulfide reductase-related iron-sulfur binding cluster [Promethearchaeota archaeon]
MGVNFKDFKQWMDKQDSYIFSGCVEEKYPAVKEGLLTAGKFLDHRFHTYSEQSCCSGPLTKMGLGNDNSLSQYTSANLNLREHDEKIIITSCNGCYAYIKKSQQTITDIDPMLLSSSDEPKDELKDKLEDEQNKINNKHNNLKPLLLHSIEYITTWREQLSLLIKFPLNDVHFAVHYGCHYNNQYQLSGEHSFRKSYAEYQDMKKWQYNTIPTYVEDIISPLGGVPVDYSESLLCCGGSTPQRQVNLDNSLAIAEKKFESIHFVKPDAVLTICPLCMYFMEESQCSPRLEAKFDEKIPLIHINELLGLMLGNEELIPLIKKSHKINLDSLIETIVIK